MIRKKQLLILIVVVLLVFIVTTNYLLIILLEPQSEVRSALISDEILKELNKLNENYKIKQPLNDSVVDNFIRNINTGGKVENLKKLWQEANSGVTKTQIVDLNGKNLGSIFMALKTAKIIKADLDNRGTQLKLLLTLEGDQTVVFKPKWYEKAKIIEGPVYAGKDRYGAEVVAFYLSAILNKPFTPISVEREISLTNDILPVASKTLLNTSFDLNNRTCVYGKCFYCKREDPICEDENFLLKGAVIFNLNATLKSYRSPWQRTYKKYRKAVWEEDRNFCKTVRNKISKQQLLDIVDTAIFDFLIQNGDRHHYESLNGNIILLDNGKSFGNPFVRHMDILAPLYQCCILKSSTWNRLLSLTGGKLRKKLAQMPDIDNLIDKRHLEAFDERLLIVFATVEYCRKRNKIF